MDARTRSGAGLPPPRLLAQVNVAFPRAGLHTPPMAGFVAAVDPVNRIAGAAPGFRWRLQSRESHGLTTGEDGGRPLVVNLSLWDSYEALHDFVYRSPHGAYLRGSSRWFLPAPQPAAALWWVGPQERPTVPDALARLRHLQAYGPTPQAFPMRRRFGPDGRPVQRRGTRAG